MIILVDQDDTLCNWWEEFSTTLTGRYPHLQFPFIPKPKHWDLHHGLGMEHIEAIADIKHESGLFRRLKPFPGARRALNEMMERGHEVFICTTPEVNNRTCASDKLEWLEKHIGNGWASRAILTSDKTLVNGDILIDDRPDIRGVSSPSWEHILFTSTHNSGIVDHRRRISDWEKWEELF